MPMKGFQLKDKSSTVNAMEQNLNETPLEAQARKDGKFAEIESQLSKRYSRSEIGLIDKVTGR